MPILGCLESPENTLAAPAPSIISVAPADGATVTTTTPTIALRVDAYLDPSTLTPASLTLRTGNTVAFATTRFDPIDLTLSLTPTVPLTPGLTYRVMLDPSVAGFGTAPLRVEEWAFTVAPNAEESPPLADHRPTWLNDIEPLLHEACGCHVADTPPPPQFTLGVLQLNEAQGRARRYIEPGDPSRSYLLHKLLPDYPDRFGTVMPPPWAEQRALTAEEVRRVADWIAAGAP